MTAFLRWKMQESAFTKITPLICISAIWGQYPLFVCLFVCFHILGSLGFTIGSGCSLMVIDPRYFFFPFIQFMKFSWQVYWVDLPFPPPVGHVLSELSAMTCLSWVALHGMAHSFTELNKPLHHDKAVIHEGEEGIRG